MPRTKDTDQRKAQFARCFIDLVTTMPAGRHVNVVDITNTVGCERKTFYYHFDNLDQLIIWIVRQAMYACVGRHYGERDRILPDPCLRDPYPDLPFYARHPDAHGHLDQSDYFRGLFAHFEDNRPYYRILFSNHQRHYLDLRAYLTNLFIPAIRADILCMLDGRRLDDEAVGFLAEYHVMGIFGRLEWYYAHTHAKVIEAERPTYWNYAHEMLALTLQRMAAPKL